MKSKVVIAAALLFSASACAAQAQDGDAARRAGRYDEAVGIYTRRIESGGGIDAYRGLARVYLETGRYADAEKLLRGTPHAATLASLLADALRSQGKNAEALTAAQAGLATADSLNARLRVALINYDMGRRDEAWRTFDTFIDSYNNAGRNLTADELAAVGVAVRYLGDRDHQMFKDALKAFDQAIAADPGNFGASVLLGDLFLDKYNSDDAVTAYTQVLRVNPRHADALAGLAGALAFDHKPGAIDTARKALQTNPQHVNAHSFMTHAFLATEDFDSARAHATAALRINSESATALTAAAAVEQVAGNTAGVQAITSKLRGHVAAEVLAALAELSVQHRQYAEAVRLANAALQHDTLAWRAWSALGINQLRMGDVANARQSLERSFKGDPYNVWVKNTLDMLDRLEKFETRTTQNFAILANAKEIDVLAPYVSALGEEAFAKLATRYGYKPPTPIRIELFDHHADFSVRTVGLSGLGALGVSFGSVLAMDAPSARRLGEFNWGSTFWHELAHAFHLGMTSHRVPRWFTEGLAVLEERRARPGWGEEGLQFFAQALDDKKLLPLDDLNSGFVRPKYDAQVQVSYYQASLILEMIEQKYGERAIREMLQGYARGKSTESLVRDVLKTTSKEIDKEFKTFAEQRVKDSARAKAASAANDYRALVAQGTQESLELAMYISPYDPAAHARLAELHAQRGDKKGVVRERQAIVALKPVDMAEARYQLALAHYEAGDVRSARSEVIRALEHAPNFERAQELLLKLAENR
jgi:tetratricopeptide (TPR) repeat protein